MSEEVEYRCFIGGLSWSTSDKGLKDAFEKFGKLIEAKVTFVLFFFFFQFCLLLSADAVVILTFGHFLLSIFLTLNVAK